MWNWGAPKLDDAWSSLLAIRCAIFSDVADSWYTVYNFYSLSFILNFYYSNPYLSYQYSKYTYIFSNLDKNKHEMNFIPNKHEL